MDNGEEGVSAKCKELCRELLSPRKARPQGTSFSDDKLFSTTCQLLRGENETKVILDKRNFIGRSKAFQFLTVWWM
jgi:hypothetical protein